MTADVEMLPELVDEGLYYFDKFGDEGDKQYVRAIRQHIAAKDAEVEALRVEVGDYRTNGAAAVRFAPNSAYWSNELRRLFGDDARTGIEVLENQYRQELARAERLAEALREAADMLLADYPETAKRLRATLNPTAAQEGKESFWPKLPGSGGPDWTGHD